MKIYPTKLVRVYKDNNENELAFAMLCEVHDEDMDLLTAIRAAAKEIAETDTSGLRPDPETLTIGDFDLLAENKICIKHGFKVIDKADSFVDIHQDMNLLE